jgi:1-acyl-sn-glycerol-3-phosphate acyltransferase
MRKILHILYQPYKWLIFAPYLVLSTLFFGFSAVLLSFILNPRIVSLLCGAFWSRLNGYMTPIFVSVFGKENINKNKSFVIVSNHQSQYDIFVLYGWLGVDFKWVMKQELRNVPALGVACEKVGHIFIDRSNPESAINSINDAKKKITNGTSVIFFAEGTRSKNGKMSHFKKGAFKLALDLELPILPITINGTKNILPSNTMDLFPGKASITIHKPVDITGYNDGNINILIEKVKTTIESCIK